MPLRAAQLPRIREPLRDPRQTDSSVVFTGRKQTFLSFQFSKRTNRQFFTEFLIPSRSQQVQKFRRAQCSRNSSGSGSISNDDRKRSHSNVTILHSFRFFKRTNRQFFPESPISSKNQQVLRFRTEQCNGSGTTNSNNSGNSNNNNNGNDVSGNSQNNDNNDNNSNHGNDSSDSNNNVNNSSNKHDNNKNHDNNNNSNNNNNNDSSNNNDNNNNDNNDSNNNNSSSDSSGSSSLSLLAGRQGFKAQRREETG